MADIRPLFASPSFFRKKLTVIGMMGHTHGVSMANMPPSIPKQKISQSELLDDCPVVSLALIWSMTGFQVSVSSLTSGSCSGAMAAVGSDVASPSWLFADVAAFSSAFPAPSSWKVKGSFVGERQLVLSQAMYSTYPVIL